MSALRSVPSAPALLRSCKTAPVSTASRPVVFLAEDDPELRRLLRESLSDAGFDVLAAANGHEMLNLMTAASRGEVAQPNAFVMDVRMPKCSGIDVLVALRLAEWEQPVVIITAFGDPALHAEAVGRRASIVLDKPFSSDELIGVLDILLLFTPLADDGDAPPPTVRCP